jgi:hypothetical protein
MPAIVTAVSRSRGHTFGKPNELMIGLLPGSASKAMRISAKR